MRMRRRTIMCRVSTEPVAAFSVPEVTGAKTSGHRPLSKYFPLLVMPNFILDKLSVGAH